MFLRLLKANGNHETNSQNQSEANLYAGLAERSKTTETQQRIGRGAYREILNPYLNRASSSVLGSRIAKGFKAKGKAALLANICKNLSLVL